MFMFVARISGYYAVHGSPYTSAHILIKIQYYNTKWPRTCAWRCVVRIECLKALAGIMGYIVVPVAVSIAAPLLS